MLCCLSKINGVIDCSDNELGSECAWLLCDYIMAKRPKAFLMLIPGDCRMVATIPEMTDSTI